MIALNIPILLPASVAILSICMLWVVFILAANNKEKRRYPPARGTILHVLFNFHRLHDYMTDQACKGLTFRILNLGKSYIYTADPTVVEYILKTNFANYGKGALQYDKLKDFLGDGIFTVDGEKWRHQRKMASYEFSTRKLREFSCGVFRTNASKLVHLISAAVASDQAIEIQDMLMKSALDSVFEVFLGVDLDTVHEINEAGTRFSKAFDRASELTLYRYVDLFWRVKKFLNIGSEATLKKCMKVVDEFVYDVIHSKIRQSRDPSQQMNKGDVLSRFIEMNETDPKYLKDIILSFIIAGKDTIASALSWFFHMMCKHPLLQEKIVQEVKKAAKLGDNSSVDEIVQNITEEALEKMHFLHASLTETLRLYPSIPIEAKTCFSDDTLPDGFHVKKGCLMAYLPYAMGRMKRLWGEDAEEFRPERWIDDNGAFKLESPFKFTAFQAGPRICIGREFAYTQMKILAAVLLSAFSFKMVDEMKQVNYLPMIILQIDGGLHLRASNRVMTH